MSSCTNNYANAISEDIGKTMYQWAEDLYPICRSITGEGVRETLAYLQKLLPDLAIKEVPSGTKVLDWTVPDEWNVKEAYIENSQGERVVDFVNHNLHLVNYSVPVNAVMGLEELDKHLYSLEDQPDAIPYVTSYYEKKWGFCLTHNDRQSLKDDQYKVVIDTELKTGVLNYGELLIPGESKEEIFLSTYVCHPSMANNELSGPVVTTALALWLQSLKSRRYSYRIIFIPETIGAITYLSQHLEEMQKRIQAGFVVTCVGDDRTYSFMPSPFENTLADKVAEHVLKHYYPEHKRYSFLKRGSDERQYCAPGVELPVVSIMRSKYHEYPEYHTSLDDLSLISPEGLQGGYQAIRQCLEVLENNYIYRATQAGEPQLGKRNLMKNTGGKSPHSAMDLLNLLTYMFGKEDLLTICERLERPMLECLEEVSLLASHQLIEKVHA